MPILRVLHLLQSPDHRLLVPGTLQPLAIDVLRQHVPDDRQSQLPSDVHSVVLVSGKEICVHLRKPLIVTTRAKPGTGYLRLLTDALADVGLNSKSDREGLIPVGVEDGPRDTHVTWYCLFCTDDMRERVVSVVRNSSWAPLVSLPDRLPLHDRVLIAVSLRSELLSLRAGDFVVFRHGQMTNGAFRVGCVTRTAKSDDGYVEVHEYGLRRRRAPSFQSRLTSRYLPLYVSSDGVLPVRPGLQPPSNAVPHERIVALSDIYTPGFKLPSFDYFLPPSVRATLSDSVLPRLALHRERLHRAYLISSRVCSLGSRLSLFVSTDLYDEDGLYAVKTHHDGGKMLEESSSMSEPSSR